MLFPMGKLLVVIALALFQSRVPYPPLVEKLKATGGDRARIVRVKTAQDLARFESGWRYKFVVDADGALLVAPLPADAPDNEYVHPILAGGGPVRTAGGITVEHKGDKITKVTVDQDSKAYCPTLASLDEAVNLLARMGVLATRQDRAPKCQ